MASKSEDRVPFVVTGLRRNGRVTYLCPTAEWALRKWNDFTHAGYVEISAKGPDGELLDERALRDVVVRSATAEPLAG